MKFAYFYKLINITNSKNIKISYQQLINWPR